MTSCRPRWTAAFSSSKPKASLAERHGIDPGQAFTLLRAYARNHNQRLTELATAVIDGTTTIETLPGALVAPGQ